MVYSQKFVMAVLVDGVPQQERGDGLVTLPFGQEYTLRFRNKHNRRAMVEIYIDGENVGGSGYIVNANSHIDIRRHHDKDAAFRFVSLESADAVDFGKNGPNDGTKGVIEARFYLERERPPIKLPMVPTPRPYRSRDYNHDWKSAQPMNMVSTKGMGEASGLGMLRSMSGPGQLSGQHTNSCFTQPDSQTIGYVDPTYSSTLPTMDGCTVEGTATGQSFYTVHFEPESTCVSLHITLKGVPLVEWNRPVVAATKPAVKRRDDIADLEAENEKLRRQLAELENSRLKAQLEEATNSA
jgi:hypothetical protein